MSAAVVAAGVSLAVVVVVVAFYVGIKSERAAEQCFNCGIRGTADAAVKLDAGFCKCCLCATADAAAYKSVNAERRKKSCKCSVTAAVGINNFAIDYFPIFSSIDHILFGMTEVLKDLPVFVSYCNFNCAVSSEFSIVKDFNAFLN